MKKTVGNKEVDISAREYQYYLHLIEKFTDEENKLSGRVYFEDTFDVDENGFIVLIKTEKSMPWAVLFFLQQLLINQRMQLNDQMAQSVKDLTDTLENKIAQLDEKMKSFE